MVFYMNLSLAYCSIPSKLLSELIFHTLSTVSTALAAALQMHLGITCQGLGMGTNELPVKVRTALKRTSASQVWPYMHQLRIIVLGQ